MSSSKTSATAHRWQLNYVDNVTNVSTAPQPQRQAPVRAALEKHVKPPGFPSETSATDPSTLRSSSSRTTAKGNASKKAATRETVATAYQASWSVAFSPVRTILTSGFALYMTGSSIQFFSVATTVTVLFMHLRSLPSVKDAFRPAYKAGVPVRSLLPQVVVHFALVLVGVAMGLYKADILGFLPTTQSDWVALLPPRIVQSGYVRQASRLTL